MNRRPDHLTDREEQILRCIRRWIEDTGEGPSVRQLAHAVGMRSRHRSPITWPTWNARAR
ncbi:LexA family protein [Streptomyces spiralis]|uniref:LexA family protein n=1 Tax=Streptomyces spiralis TaxID=66376 RepID=UPI001E377C60|nr:hypothetical protein [Streptomyces spiralis]